jgi:hypothetical protein
LDGPFGCRAEPRRQRGSCPPARQAPRAVVAEDLQDERRDHAAAAARRLQELYRPIGQALRDLHPRAELNATDDKSTQNILKSRRHWGQPEIVWRWHRCSRVSVGSEPRSYRLRHGRALELDEDGKLILHAFIDVGVAGTAGNDFYWQPQARQATAGTVEADQMLSGGVSEVTAALQQAIEVFVDNVPEGTE